MIGVLFSISLFVIVSSIGTNPYYNINPSLDFSLRKQRSLLRKAVFSSSISAIIHIVINESLRGATSFSQQLSTIATT